MLIQILFPLSPVMALVWLYAREITFALVPFAIYSIFHVASYSRSYLIPTIFPPTRNSDGTLTQHVWIDSLSRFVKTYHDASMSIVAQFELMVLVRLFFTAFSFQTGSMLLFGVYAMFYRFRYHNSIFVKAATAHAEARVDTALSHRSTPNWIRGGWEVFKKAVAKAYWALDLERYVSEQPRKDH